jgi:single-stranded-DNA-specific exonuclease
MTIEIQDKKWQLKPLPSPEEIARLSAMLNVSELVAKLLLQRNINSFERVNQFFRPELTHLHNPFLMKDMDLAAERLIKALLSGEKILIYGDYDVDGTTSVAMFYGLLRRYFTNLEYYISDRYLEGYGISERGLEYASNNGFTLIVTLDCGIKSNDKILKAKELGIDFIICDHHTVGELPQAIAVLDPKRADCNYPFKDLTGCGVGFKLLQAIAPTLNIPENVLYEQLDLLAVSIACDIVPIVGENRIFAKFGIDLLNKHPKPALKALMKRAEMAVGMVNISSIVFGLGPRINAAGRIAHANMAVEMLLANTDEEAHERAKSIEDKNQIRKGYDLEITEEALAMIDELRKSDTKTTVLYKPKWHKGVVGIVASRCVELLYRPTVVLTDANGRISGSARSVEGFDVHQAIFECADVVEHFGGHKYAAGVTLLPENLELFKQRFEEVVAATITEEQLIPKIDIDLEVSFDELDFEQQKILSQFAPFGPENMQPILMTKNVVSVGEVRILKEKHLKMTLREANGTKTMEAIGFGMIDYYPIVITKKPFDVCFQLDINDFKGSKTLQLVLKEIKKHNY